MFDEDSLYDEDTMENESYGIWTDTQEEQLKNWAEKSLGYKWMLKKSYNYYNRLDKTMAIIGVILAAAGGIEKFANNPDCTDNVNAGISIAFGVLLFLLTAIIGIQKLLEFGSLAESSKKTSNNFSELSEFIASQLVLHRSDRRKPKSLIEGVRKRYNEIVSLTPTIPDIVISNFNKRFGNMDQFSKPEITGHLQPIKIYRSNQDPLAINQTTPKPSPILESTNEILNNMNSSQINDNNNNNNQINNNNNNQINNNNKDDRGDLELHSNRKNSITEEGSNNLQDEFEKLLKNM